MKRLLPWLILGLVIRVLLMSTTIHPDFRAVNMAGYLIAQKGEVFTFYDHLSKLPRSHPWVKLYGDGLFIYPPLAYLSHGVFNALLYPLYPQPLFKTLLDDIGRTSGSSQLPQLLFLLKLPYLFVDIVSLLVLRKILDPSKKFLGSVLWIFNPVTLYVTYMIGQFDIFIALFILLSLFFSKSRPGMAAIMLALGAGFKPFTLFFLPLLPGSKIRNVGLGIFSYLILILPYLGSVGFKQYALLATLTDKLSYAKILVSGSQYLSLFFVGLVLLYIINYLNSKLFAAWAWFMSVLLLFYSVTNFHPQWFMWVTPLLVISWTKVARFKLLVLGLLFCYGLIVLLFESSLNFGLFGIKLSFADIVSHRFPPDELASIARSVLAALSIVMVAMFKHASDKQT